MNEPPTPRYADGREAGEEGSRWFRASQDALIDAVLADDPAATKEYARRVRNRQRKRAERERRKAAKDA